MGAPCIDAQTRERQVAKILLEMRGEGTDWGQPYQSGGERWSKRIANMFLVCSMLDYRMKNGAPWRNGERLVKDILGDPDDIWRAITSVPESEWESKHSEYRLHMYPMAHLRLWRTATLVCSEYAGDARQIWECKDPSSALEALWKVRVGDQISRMIVGALRDCGQIKGSTSDVKGDVYVRRVLGRAVLGQSTDAETAVALARRVNPADPWQLDAALWIIGSGNCKTTPSCSQCKLLFHCAYASNIAA